MVLWPRMFFERADGLYAGWRTVWADWVVHLAYANVFAERPVREWFSSHPLFATRRFDYPPLADAISGLLMRAGVDRVDAFVLPSILASLALVGLLFAFYARLLGSRRLALLASTLFFANGGLGFLLLGRQLARSPSLALSLLRFPPREYTHLPEHGIHWINVVSAELLPQRALLLGVPIALALLVALWRARECGFAGVSNRRLCALGVLSSLLLVAHVHSFLVLVLLCGLLLLFDRHRARPWLVFAAAAALPCLVFLGLFYSGAGSEGFLAWHPGWLSRPGGGDGQPLWLFLWLNWGVFLPLAVAGVLRFRDWRHPLVLGGILLFVACFLIRFQPYLWDNTKLLTWAHLLLCVPVARYLALLWSRRGMFWRPLAVGLFVFATASGFLELWRVTQTPRVAVRMWSREEMELAEAFRQISPPEARVLCADSHHHWVPGLAGRPVLLGFRAWLWSYGIDFAAVARDVPRMLGGGPEAEALMDRYGVDYVVIGEPERRGFGAAERYFEERQDLVLEGAGNKVFERSRRAGGQEP